MSSFLFVDSFDLIAAFFASSNLRGATLRSGLRGSVSTMW
jgi:hypothetical protein